MPAHRCPPLARRRRLGAFTLIELLVVIAVVALLIVILLPALRLARLAAWRVQSMSNLRQITVAATAYREDNRDYLPITLVYPRGSTARSPDLACGHCTWSFGGKNNDAYWAGANPCQDVEAADRPLNPYLYPETRFNAPPFPIPLARDNPARTSLQLEIFRDPSDRLSFNRNDAAYSDSIDLPGYDDVGTSYHYNNMWLYEIKANASYLRHVHNPGRWTAFYIGTELVRQAGVFRPAKFVWAHDQYTMVVTRNRDHAFRIKNGFGDVNKSVMAFMDGHVDYVRAVPGSNDKAFVTERYQLYFEAFRREFSGG